MTSQEQNETIAVLCGYWKDTENRWHRSSGAYRNVPSYTSDLNAMNDAEVVLTEQQEFHYHDELHKLCNKGKRHACYESIRAPAHKRTEAFLKTLGKWKE